MDVIYCFCNKNQIKIGIKSRFMLLKFFSICWIRNFSKKKNNNFGSEWVRIIYFSVFSKSLFLRLLRHFNVWGRWQTLLQSPFKKKKLSKVFTEDFRAISRIVAISAILTRFSEKKNVFWCDTQQCMDSSFFSNCENFDLTCNGLILA